MSFWIRSADFLVSFPKRRSVTTLLSVTYLVRPNASRTCQFARFRSESIPVYPCRYVLPILMIQHDLCHTAQLQSILDEGRPHSDGGIQRRSFDVPDASFVLPISHRKQMDSLWDKVLLTQPTSEQI
ncbi:unnamed protein product [Cyclocybe aegerita]|uniref:Uncharacterized protein n=1 Tax=Cyclocybe aegerita TaxID=1973307 RepID=A0A8S0W6W2_CYCAE|nr:unnamed protein product [Cyclocybe aegerita]